MVVGISVPDAPRADTVSYCSTRTTSATFIIGVAEVQNTGTPYPSTSN